MADKPDYQITPLGSDQGVRSAHIVGGAAIVCTAGYSPHTVAVLTREEMDALVTWWAEHRPEED